jgi:hypothetical protein
MKAAVLRKLILLGSFHYALREKEDQTARYFRLCATQPHRFSVILKGGFTIIEPV